MSRTRFDNLEPEKQNRLLQSASEEFGANGYEGASLNRILERSGMSKSSLYYYFDDKADLFTTLLERSLEFLFREMGGFDVSALTAENFWDECEAFYRRSIRLVSKDAWYVKLGRMFYRLRGDKKQGKPTDRMMSAAQSWLETLVRRGQELGVIRTDLPAELLAGSALGLGESLDHWVLANWDMLDEPAREAMPPVHIDLFKRLLSPAGGPGQS